MHEIRVTKSRKYSNFHMFNIPFIFKKLKFLLEVDDQKIAMLTICLWVYLSDKCKKPERN
jgi:hypothetical protein